MGQRHPVSASFLARCRYINPARNTGDRGRWHYLKREAAFPDDPPNPQRIYERIALPPQIRPDITQVRLFSGRYVCFGDCVTATAPVGLEQGSPFGASIAAMVVYLHYAHVIGLERLALLMTEPSSAPSQCCM